MSHPDVFEAAVVGVPSELSEEEIKAFVVAERRGRRPAGGARARGRPARAVQGAALHGGDGRAAAHADRAHRQAPARPRAHRRRGRLREESMTDDWLRTDIGATTADTITVRGRDLAGELMGRVTFTELAFLLVQGRRPAAGEATLLDAVLVSLADHGLTPTVLAARLTYTGAPESLQGAVAAGLLGAGIGVPGRRRGRGRVPDRDHRRPHRRSPTPTCVRPPARRWPHGSRRRAHPRPRPPDPQGGGPAHAADVRDRRGGGRARAAPAGAARWCGRPQRSRRASRFRSTAPARPGPRSPTSVSTPAHRARVRAARAHGRGRGAPGRGDAAPDRHAALPRARRAPVRGGAVSGVVERCVAREL